MNQSELEANTCSRRQARENACERGTISLGFTSCWLKKGREFDQPITERSKAKPKHTRNYFRHSIENRSINRSKLGSWIGKELSLLTFRQPKRQSVVLSPWLLIWSVNDVAMLLVVYQLSRDVIRCKQWLMRACICCKVLQYMHLVQSVTTRASHLVQSVEVVSLDSDFWLVSSFFFPFSPFRFAVMGLSRRKLSL